MVQKSGEHTSWGNVVYHVIYQVLYIPDGAGFLPSTVWWNPNQPTMFWLEVGNIPKWKRNIIFKSWSMKVFCGRVCRVRPPILTAQTTKQTYLLYMPIQWLFSKKIRGLKIHFNFRLKENLSTPGFKKLIHLHIWRFNPLPENLGFGQGDFLKKNGNDPFSCSKSSNLWKCI